MNKLWSKAEQSKKADLMDELMGEFPAIKETPLQTQIINVIK